ncbi:hypothetical protein VFPPC_18327 [Pochonia chlamydosporia 170]|uniref:Uncharacterized protein n=1 Tax=Pochonia chlamydosporia 170 TaxID=1380566 RepID=A0A219AQS3_METCM|nr:hypothetical protein VFPPC_18327 [Pochonia chlamydosporia 170]OWT42525.1 hypothetical protein VFPPC_18327 [Pochonia chlamydosporia 170]
MNEIDHIHRNSQAQSRGSRIPPDRTLWKPPLGPTKNVWTTRWVNVSLPIHAKFFERGDHLTRLDATSTGQDQLTFWGNIRDEFVKWIQYFFTVQLSHKAASTSTPPIEDNAHHPSDPISLSLGQMPAVVILPASIQLLIDVWPRVLSITQLIN